MKKIILGLAITVFCFGGNTFAQIEGNSETESSTPKVTENTAAPTSSGSAPAPAQGEGYGVLPSEGDLAKKLADGTVELNDIPGLALYWIDWLPRLGALISVMMIVYAGFLFVVSGITENKEEAKNTMKYAIYGVIVTSLAWVIVNFLQVFLTR